MNFEKRKKIQKKIIINKEIQHKNNLTGQENLKNYNCTVLPCICNKLDNYACLKKLFSDTSKHQNSGFAITRQPTVYLKF